MDRVLTGFLMRVNHNGQPSKLAHAHKSDEFVQEFLDEKYADRFQGFRDSPDMARRWIETQLLDMVNRGKPSQAVAGLRPLHGLTYKFRNYYHSRSYGADAQLYEMLRHARNGRGTLALEGIRSFFFNGLDPALGTALPGSSLDVETQAVLHLNSQVKHDTPQTVKGWYSAPPLCVGQSDLLADDVLRLLSLRDLLPRIVMVDYLKILFAFHLALGQLKTMKLLSSFVERSAVEPTCGPENCPVGPGQGHDDLGACPFHVGLFVDAAGVPGTSIAALAERSAEVWLRRIPGFVRAGYTVRKLDEFAEHMAGRGEITRPSRGFFTVAEVLQYASKPYQERREQFFTSRMDTLLDDTPVDEQPEHVRPLLGADMGLGSFEQYIELLMAYRGKYHNDYIIETIDSLLLKNRPGAVIAQPYRGRRRFVLDSALLEVLVQIALLRPNPRGTKSPLLHHTASLRLDQFMDILRRRYGLYVNRLPVEDGFASVGFEEQATLRSNAEAFTTRMREIGFYSDLSDAYLTQVITPRFVIGEDGSVVAGGR
ncbi:hypothetical protein ACFWVC_06035 [Streptomyces sp. NPDC058691]|uniref:methylation-associated defense system protein MAD7 n=1 Tax=Streptomyces sp. NPDC058691 TaxID=3346601 RepID=UPI00364D7B64